MAASGRFNSRFALNLRKERPTPLHQPQLNEEGDPQCVWRHAGRGSCICGARFSHDSPLLEQASGLVLFAMPREIRTDCLSLDAFQMVPCQAQAGANTEMRCGISGQLV